MTRIIAVAETGSTNADLLALARAGGEDGLWLRADAQTAGRGRQGRAWNSPPGNLYASTIVRLHPGDPPPATLAFVAATALHRTISETHPANIGDLTIKWPNDLLLDGAKVSGILLERENDAVVIGFGVNLAHAPVLDRPTAHLGGRLTPAAFLPPLCGIFANIRAIWSAEGLAPVLGDWSAHAHPPGTPLTARLPDGEGVTGTFDGLSPDGALILRLAGGASRAIHAADVFLV